jgi:N-acetyl sugar amidotransferase
MLKLELSELEVNKKGQQYTRDKQIALLPEEVIYCKKCVVSNQRPRIVFDQDGVCAACNYAEEKNHIDYVIREEELKKLLDQHRSKTGDFDVIVPCSGGKDSAVVAHRLKHDYGMRPLTVTWAPLLYTDIGRLNFDRFVEAGFDNITCSPNGEQHRRMAALSFEHLGDPFHVFVMGQIAYPFRLAVQMGIPLIFYGENGNAEYAGLASIKDKPGMALEDFSGMELKGDNNESFLSNQITENDLSLYKMPSPGLMKEKKITHRWWGYYHKWNPQENYYYATENTGFQANPERSQGTFTKYASLDDKFDGLHHYLGLIKFGFGRATQDAAQEIRSGHITREEGVALVRRYDQEFPSKYFEDSLKYLNMTERKFWTIANRYRRDNIWKNLGENNWELHHQIE